MNKVSACYVVQVALKLVPENKTFIRFLLAEDEECSLLKEEIQSLVSLLSPILNEMHAILVSYKLFSVLEKYSWHSVETFNFGKAVITPERK